MRGLQRLTLFCALIALSSVAAFALPENWQLYFQTPATPVMEHLVGFHDTLLWIEGIIGTLVLGLLFYVIYRFRASRNPLPSKTSHNTMLEVIWTTIPVLILVVIVFPSMRLLYYMDVVPKADMTLKVTGYQWYWGYEYPDHDISFDSVIVEKKDLQPGQHRLLETDNHVVVPVDTVVRVITTAADVLHSWAVPAFGVKRDAVPGRINEAWFKATKEGTYYGQCSELCGIKHGFMPIVVEVVSKPKFALWVAEKKGGAAPAPGAVIPVNSAPAPAAAPAPSVPAPAVNAPAPAAAVPASPASPDTTPQSTPLPAPQGAPAELTKKEEK